MIELGAGKDCICKKYINTQMQCQDLYTICEKGKSVRLVPKINEQALVIILDGCLIQDNDPKCDAIFLYRRLTDQFSFLIELKGAHDIPRAFYQLQITANRPEYKDIIHCTGGSFSGTAKAVRE